MIKTILSEIVYLHLLCENVSTSLSGMPRFYYLIQRGTYLVKNIERYEL